MGLLVIIVSSLISAFVGFAIGRFGDKHGGYLNTPHHWIFGLVLIIIGLVYINKWIGILSFGVGLFISDLDDFIKMKIWSVDEHHEWKFWSIK